MNTTIKRICLILCFALMLSFLVSCDNSSTVGDQSDETTSAITTEAESETESESEETTDETTEETEEPVETEIIDEAICFADYTRNNRNYYDLKVKGDLGISFVVPSGQLKEMYVTITDISKPTECSIDINLYNFDGDYADSVKTAPVYHEYVTTTMRTHTIVFPEGTVPKGQYLLVLSYVEPEVEVESDVESESGSDAASGDVPAAVEIHSKVISDFCWIPKTFPEEYKQYNFKSYINGSVNKKTAVCGGFLIEHGVEVEADDDAPEDTEELPPFPDNVAKVILLGGQSNATGSSVNSLLKNNVGEEKYQEYTNGYSNVKILYTSGTASGGFKYPNVVSEFVDTKVGQGYQTYNFGPELGLAEYLSYTYPDETFYIIKYAIGGTGLNAHWNPTNDERDISLEGFYEKVDLGLSLLEDEGLDPRIVGFLWMQGESDASTVNSANAYYELQKALVEQIRDEYAFFAPEKGIPFIDATISNSGMWASWFLLNDRKIKYSRESELNFCVDTNAHGLTTLEENNDIAHYDSMSMILLGKLFGEEVTKALEYLDQD